MRPPSGVLPLFRGRCARLRSEAKPVESQE